MKTSPRTATVDRKKHTDSLPSKIAGVRSIFRNEVDKMATKKKKANLDFYNGYFVARTIVNRAATQKPKPAEPVPKK